MRKLILLLVSLLLVGCELMATPTPSPTPRPTVTPTEEVRFMPTADIDTAKAIHKHFSDYVKQSPWQTIPENRIVISSLVSTGETGSMEVLLEKHVVSVDYLVVYDYIYLGFGVPTVEVAYGIYDQEKYFYCEW